MRKSVIVFGVVAIGLAGGTVYFVQNWLKSQRAALEAEKSKNKGAPTKVVKAAPKTFVLVAKKSLPTGAFIQKNDLRWQSWPDQNVPKGYIKQVGNQPVASLNKQLRGAVVRRGIAEGQPITLDFIVKPGDRGFLAAVLRPGMRAVSIAVDDASGISGLVFPGDRVDVLVTYEINSEVPKASGGFRTVTNRVSETILVRTRVLAIDQKTDVLDGKPSRAKTITLEVLPKQAETIAVATRMGALSLSLRSLANNGDAKDDRKTLLNGTAGATTASDAKGSEKRPDCTPGSLARPCKEESPERGRTYTIDAEISRVLRRAKTTETSSINVVRGDKSNTFDPKTGSASKNKKDTAKPAGSSSKTGRPATSTAERTGDR